MEHTIGPDEPYSLDPREHPAECERRRNLLRRSHMKRLADFVEEIRRERQGEIPDFDPCDGGIGARVLFLLEAPGPMAVKSGFVSRNNPDPTARNMCDLLLKARLERRQTLLWNIVPWYCGNGRKICPPTRDEVEMGMRYLQQLLQLLRPHLRYVALLGLSAWKAEPELPKTLKVFKTFHPSNRVRYRWDGKKYDEIRRTCSDIAKWLRSDAHRLT